MFGKRRSDAAAEARLSALEAQLKAMDARIENVEHIAKSARGYVTKKLALYEAEEEKATSNGRGDLVRLAKQKGLL